MATLNSEGKIKLVQHYLMEVAGQTLTKFGADGDLGDETTEALTKSGLSFDEAYAKAAILVQEKLAAQGHFNGNTAPNIGPKTMEALNKSGLVDGNGEIDFAKALRPVAAIAKATTIDEGVIFGEGDGGGFKKTKDDKEQRPEESDDDYIARMDREAEEFLNRNNNSGKAVVTTFDPLPPESRQLVGPDVGLGLGVSGGLAGGECGPDGFVVPRAEFFATDGKTFFQAEGSAIISGDVAGKSLYASPQMGNNSAFPAVNNYYGIISAEAGSILKQTSDERLTVGIAGQVALQRDREPRAVPLTAMFGPQVKWQKIGENGNLTEVSALAPALAFDGDTFGIGGGVGLRADNGAVDPITGRPTTGFVSGYVNGAYTSNNGLSATAGFSTIQGGTVGDEANPRHLNAVLEGHGGISMMNGDPTVRVGGGAKVTLTKRENDDAKIADSVYVRARYDQMFINGATTMGNAEVALGGNFSPLARAATKGDVVAAGEVHARSITATSFVPAATAIGGSIAFGNQVARISKEGNVYKTLDNGMAVRGEIYMIANCVPLPMLAGDITRPSDRDTKIPQNMSRADAVGALTEQYQAEAAGSVDTKSRYHQDYRLQLTQVLDDYADNGKCGVHVGDAQLGNVDWRKESKSHITMAQALAKAQPLIAKELVYDAKYNGNTHIESLRAHYNIEASRGNNLLNPEVAARSVIVGDTAAAQVSTRVQTLTPTDDKDYTKFFNLTKDYAANGKVDKPALTMGYGKTSDGQSWSAVDNTAQQLANAMKQANAIALAKVASLSETDFSLRKEDQLARVNEFLAAARSEVGGNQYTNAARAIGTTARDQFDQQHSYNASSTTQLNAGDCTTVSRISGGKVLKDGNFSEQSVINLKNSIAKQHGVSGDDITITRLNLNSRHDGKNAGLTSGFTLESPEKNEFTGTYTIGGKEYGFEKHSSSNASWTPNLTIMQKAECCKGPKINPPTGGPSVTPTPTPAPIATPSVTAMASPTSPTLLPTPQAGKGIDTAHIG